MAKPGKKAALKRLTEARRKLEHVQTAGKNPEPWIASVEYERANEEVAKAEKAVRFGSQRGWNYTAD